MNPDPFPVKSPRLVSLDALRGFYMFWIMSGEQIVHALAKSTGWSVFTVMSDQLHHTVWNGFAFYDMIFPLFLFIAGAIPVPGYGAGVLTMEGSLESYIDRLLLPGRLHDRIHDPEGVLSTIPSIGTALLGVFILLLSVFYLVIDAAGYKKWAFPLIIIGANSIIIYITSEGMIDFGHTANYVFGGLVHLSPSSCQPVWTALSLTFVQWVFLYFLYRKKIFLKI